ncbi:hypothetical protein FHS78_002754 [Parvibaculum indicum]|uniref:hypothetical protein n=1 Tax=Parvibaculum indicum TaxID=562969 RepID=UPI0031B5D9C0|nr:hypothetical protein [Parvibaculum indicum]
MNETNEQDAESIDWAAVRRAYADPAIPLRETAATLGIPWQTLSARATREGWPMRCTQSRAKNAAPEERATAGRLTQANLLTRLRRLIDREIGDIEKEYEQDGAPADRERAAKRLTVLVRSLDKLTEIQNATKKAKPKDGADKGGAALRAELERRLVGLAAGNGEARLPEKPDGEGSGVSD